MEKSHELAQRAQIGGFQREDRYIVIKRKDLDAAPMKYREWFKGMLSELEPHLPKRQYLAIESDWPEYEPTWAAIQARVTGKGVQAGDELVAKAIYDADRSVFMTKSEYAELHDTTKARLRKMARAALATQPAADEPIGKVELFGINMTYVEWRERKMPPLGTELYTAPPASAPVAAGEPVAFANELISGALQGGDFSGADIQELAVKHGLLREEQRDEACRYEGCACAEYGFPTECYRKTAALAPPAAAHGDEAVRKDAERYRLLRRKVAIVGTERKAEFCILNLEPVHIAPNPSIEFDAAIDAAMRAQGEGGEV